MNPYYYQHYEDKLKELFLNETLVVKFVKKNLANNYSNNEDLKFLLQRCIDDPLGYKELFLNFQWEVNIIFNDEFIKKNNISNAIKLMNNNFLSNKAKNDYEFELQPALYNKLPENVQRMLIKKILQSVIFKISDINQFKIGQLNSEQLGGYYLFTLNLLYEQKNNNQFLSEIFGKIFSIKHSLIEYKSFDFLDLCNTLLYPKHKDYFFKKYLTPPIVHQLMNFSDNSNSIIQTHIHKLSPSAIELFYEIYFKTLSKAQNNPVKLISLFRKIDTPSYIKNKYEDYFKINLDEIPILNTQSPSNTQEVSIVNHIHLNPSDISLTYSKYFLSTSFMRSLYSLSISTFFNSTKVSLTSKQISSNDLIFTLTSIIPTSDSKDDAILLSSKSEKIIALFTQYYVKHIIEQEINNDFSNHNSSFIFERVLQQIRSDNLYSHLDIDYNTSRVKPKI